MKKSNLRTGIVGLGNMGREHAQRILAGEIPGLTLTAACDEDPARLAPWREHAGVSFHTSFSEMIGTGLDAVVIATPHYAHTFQGIEALEAGVHVLVEKPISVHVADAQRLIAAHSRPEQVFAVMFQMRTDPVFIKLKRLLDSGELGVLQRITWITTDWFRTDHYYKSGGWRATWGGEGGGVLVNQCPHQLDLYQWLFGMPERVRAFCGIGRYHDIEVEDTVTAYYEHANGATGMFITTTGEAPGTNRLEVAGDRGKVVIEEGVFRFTRNEMSATEFLRTSGTSFDKPETWNITIPIPGRPAGHAGILRNFAAACLDGAALIAPASEGLHSIELANAMLLSSATGATLSLPIDATAYAGWLNERIAGSRYRKQS